MPAPSPAPSPARLIAALDASIARHADDQIAFLQQLVQTPSANPFTPETTDPHRPIERAVAHIIADTLAALGLEPVLSGASPARPNVVARLPGASPGGPALILNGHMDTVMPGDEWPTDPYAATLHDDSSTPGGARLVGLGALDMKASLSAFVFLARALREADVALGGELVLTFVVDEEPGGCSALGTAHVLETALGDLVARAAAHHPAAAPVAAIVAEPMNDNVATGHRGGYRFKLTTHGAAAHTGLGAWERGEAGRNAILDMMRAVRALHDLELPFTPTPTFPGRVPVFTFPTLIAGGAGINIVPEACHAYGDARLLPGADGDAVEALIRARLDALPDLPYTLDRLLAVPSVTIPAAHSLVQSLVAHTAAVTGQRPTTEGCGPWNDGWMFITRGIPAVCGFGPNGAGVHSPGEYVALASLIETTRILARVVVDLLGVAD